MEFINRLPKKWNKYLVEGWVEQTSFRKSDVLLILFILLINKSSKSKFKLSITVFGTSFSEMETIVGEYLSW